MHEKQSYFPANHLIYHFANGVFTFQFEPEWTCTADKHESQSSNICISLSEKEICKAKLNGNKLEESKSKELVRGKKKVEKDLEKIKRIFNKDLLIVNFVDTDDIHRFCKNGKVPRKQCQLMFGAHPHVTVHKAMQQCHSL